MPKSKRLCPKCSKFVTNINRHNKRGCKNSFKEPKDTRFISKLKQDFIDEVHSLLKWRRDKDD